MRSDLVFEAVGALQNRYVACQLVSKATRKFHKPNTRIQDTMNEVLGRLASSRSAAAALDLTNFEMPERRAA